MEYLVDPISIIVPVVVCGLILLSIAVIFLIVCSVCWCYKKNKMKAEAHAIELQERIEREREMNVKNQEELEQQVENMASQVVVVHSQMKGGYSVMFHTVWCMYVVVICSRMIVQ